MLIFWQTPVGEEAGSGKRGWAMYGTLTLRSRGDVDLKQADGLRTTWFAALEEEEPDLVVLDLTDVTFMDMSGLRVIADVVGMQRARGGGVGVSNASPMILHLLRVTSLSDLVELIEALQVREVNVSVPADPAWRHRYF
jgi:anti-anti-sigma factor